MFELDLHMIMMNQQAKCLGQISFSFKIIVCTIALIDLISTLDLLARAFVLLGDHRRVHAENDSIALIDSPYLLLKIESFSACLCRRSLSRTNTLASRSSVDDTSISAIFSNK